MIGRVALLVTFKKAKPKSQSLSRSHIRDLATIKNNQMKKAIQITFLILITTLVQAQTNPSIFQLNLSSDDLIVIKSGSVTNDGVLIFNRDEMSLQTGDMDQYLEIIVGSNYSNSLKALNSEWLFETFKAFTKGDLTIQSLKIFKDSKNRRNVLIKYWDFESESWVESLLADVTELHKS